MRKLFCYIACLDEMNLGKDVFLFPYWLGKMYNVEVEIMYPYSADNHLPNNYRGVKLTPARFATNYNHFSIFGEWFYFFHILFNAKKIDILIRWHYSINTFIMLFLYKLIHPHGISIIKGDNWGIFKSLTRKETSLRIKLSNRIFRFIANLQCNLADIITVDTKELFDYISSGECGFFISDSKIKIVRNMFDEDLMERLAIQELKFEEKENIILTVGRIGAYEKNTELLLDSISSIDIKNWKVVIIGPIDPTFENTKNQFFISNPQLIDKVIFLGPIYDKKRLWEWYNKSKVFVLTSRREGFALVYMEAIRFNNFILTTDVGGARDALQVGHGKILSATVADFANELQSLIDDDSVLCEVMSIPVDKYALSWENELKQFKDLAL